MRFESTLMATSKSIRRAYDRSLQPLGLNLSEACLLAYVVERGPLTQTQVAQSIGMGRAPAGSIVDTLTKRRLIQRHPDHDDRRVWLLEPTASGRDLALRIAEVDVKLRAALREGLGRLERQQLAATLVRLRKNLEGLLTPSDEE